LTQITQADDLTADLGTDHCRQIRRHIFSDLSTMAMDLALHYIKTAERHDYERANEELSAIHEKLCIDDLNLYSDTEELQKIAKWLAARCRFLSHDDIH
jgi:hypothetical protein